jgi:hypothetical protein
MPLFSSWFVRKLGYEDVVHYQRIISVLKETNEIMSGEL